MTSWWITISQIAKLSIFVLITRGKKTRCSCLLGYELYSSRKKSLFCSYKIMRLFDEKEHDCHRLIQSSTHDRILKSMCTNVFWILHPRQNQTIVLDMPFLAGGDGWFESPKLNIFDIKSSYFYPIRIYIFSIVVSSSCMPGKRVGGWVNILSALEEFLPENCIYRAHHRRARGSYI
jgi:hypothetical protein